MNRAASRGWTIESGPERIGNEQVWRMRLADGRRAVLAQLVPELAREEALRRRYVRDAEWLRDLGAPVVAEVIEVGPAPDPRDPAADPPWRLRVDPDGELLEDWLRARAPAPVDEAVLLAARLCDALAEVHGRGAVLRDLQPRHVVIGERVWFTDVGLSRSDILSSRTASSLILEGSPYASPEHLRSTRVDPRSDLYTVGVILWRALTGTLPFGDGPALLAARGAQPRLSLARPGAPELLDSILERCLASRPEERFDSAPELAAALRGGSSPGKALALMACQACGVQLRMGLRLCLHCGKAAVQFRYQVGSDVALDLVKVKEDAIYLTPLRELLHAVSEPPARPLNFMVGDRRMYSKEERETLIALPARLWTDLSDDSARELEKRMTSAGVKVARRSTRSARRRRRAGATGMIASGAAMVVLFATLHPLLALLCLPAMLVSLGLLISSRGADRQPILSLRPSPAALLPAADSLVARLWATIQADAQPDVVEQLSELALLVQRLTDRRTELLGGARAELEAVTAPVEPLVAILEKQAAALVALDRELVSLDEGVMVRALAASEARGEPRARREAILSGLDRLRALEDARVAHMRRLLDASSLLRRTIELGLRVPDEEAMQRAELERARALLEV
ncbi:MAG TPA: serine/threonine-protein kinase [Kofleriaceae bacterium]|nr:serine/threonine-protein kinase [Kofleriaceae bacterium]